MAVTNLLPNPWFTPQERFDIPKTGFRLHLAISAVTGNPEVFEVLRDNEPLFVSVVNEVLLDLPRDVVLSADPLAQIKFNIQGAMNVHLEKLHIEGEVGESNQVDDILITGFGLSQ